jgi:predicted small lipoprotein YifL
MRTLSRSLPRLLLAWITLAFALTACGNRTPLQLPKPNTKPPATTPAESEAK